MILYLFVCLFVLLSSSIVLVAVVLCVRIDCVGMRFEWWISNNRNPSLCNMVASDREMDLNSRAEVV